MKYVGWIAVFRWIAVFIGGCSGETSDVPRGAPPAFSDSMIVWEELDIAGARDLGHPAALLPEGDRIDSSALRLTEIGESAGLGDSQAGGNPHGVGVGFVDVDGDEYEDIVLVTGTGFPAALYRNERDGTFADISQASGIRGLLDERDAYSVAAADFDADGDFDLYVGAHPNDMLLVNDGGGVFRDATDEAGAGGPPTEQPGSASKIVAWGDYDGDGWIDVAVASSTFEDRRTNGYLLRNLGNGTFEDVTEETGFFASDQGNPCAMMWSDIDADGDQDVWIWNDRGNVRENRTLLVNEGGRFVDMTIEAGVIVDAGNPMGIDSADLDHDGLLDIYVSDIGGNELYVRQPDGTYVEMAREAGAAGEYGWGIVLEDFDGDSWTDMFVAQEDDRPYLSFHNQQVSPPLFEEQAWTHGEIGNGHNVAVAAADFDRNGTVDIVTAGTSGTRMNLYRNDTDHGSHRFLEVRVARVPGTGARGGISARVVVKTGDLLQFRDITGGSSRASQNAMSVRFGLGQWSGAEWVAVLWPNGRQQVVANVEGNQVLEF
ncbi:MAG: CRTAC1 family protein [Myxococcota bacterium]